MVRKFLVAVLTALLALGLVSTASAGDRPGHHAAINGETAGTGNSGAGTPPAGAPGSATPSTPGGNVDFQPALDAPYPAGQTPGTNTALNWHFSELIPDAVQSTNLPGTDCTLYVGIVKDPGPTGGVDNEDVSRFNYRIFSGTTIVCATPANLLSAGSVVQYCTATTEAECTTDSPNWSDATGPNNGVLANTFGSGDTLLVSFGICRGTVSYVRAAAENVGVDGLTYGTIVGIPHAVSDQTGGCIDANTPSPGGSAA